MVHEKNPEHVFFKSRHMNKTIVVVKYNFDNFNFDEVNCSPNM